MATPEQTLVLAWHAALNAGDLERLLALSSPDIEVGGPRGATRGAEVLRDWATRSGIRLEPRQCFGEAATVVVEQVARWPGESGESGEPQVVASVFRVEAGRVSSVVRYPDVAAARAAAGL